MQTRHLALRVLIYQNKVDNTLIEYLKANNISVDTSTENTIKSKLRINDFDLCILDACASSNDPLDLVRFLRSIDTRTPIIFLSSIADWSIKIGAFNAGADDYVEMPYNMEELICRIDAVLKRCGIKTRKVEPTYNIGPYIFYTREKILALGDNKIPMANKEAEILALLCAYKGDILPKEVLLRNIWHDDNFFIKRSLDVYMCNIRNRFKEYSNIKINTLRGYGYTLIIED